MTGLTEKQDQLEAIWLDPLAAGTSAGKWQDLASAASDPNPFYSPSFLQPYLRALPAKSIRLLVIRNKTTGTWLMAAPACRQPAGLAVPVRTVWTSHYAPLGTPLLHPCVSLDALKLFVSAASGPAHVLALPFLPRESRFARLAAGLPDWTASWSHVIDRAGHSAGQKGHSELTAAFHGKKRKEMRRQLRRLEDHGPVSVRHLSGTDTIRGFDDFLDLEARGWKGRAGTALVNQPETAAFARDMILARAPRNGIRIDQLWAGNSLVASLVLLVEGDRVFSWKIAFDEAFARMSPGAQIAIIALKQNLAMPEFKFADSLAIPGHPMIEALWRGRVSVGTLLLSNGAAGTALAGLARADLTIEQALRKKARTLKNLIGRRLG